MSRVNHPKHYQGKVETIDLIEAVVEGREGAQAFAIGTAVKYLSRAGRKGQGDAEPTIDDAIEDLEKAKWYIDRAIDDLRAKAGAVAQQVVEAFVAQVFDDLREGRSE